MSKQPNILKRIYYFVLGKSHAVLDKIESPEDQLRVFVDDLTREVKKMHQAVTLAVADEKKMKNKIQDLLSRAADWEKKAVLALNAGQESLAKEALVKKEESETQAMSLKNEWEKQKITVEQLKKSLHASHERVEKAKRDYTVLLARYRTAKTQQDLGRKLTSTSQESPLAMMDALNDKILKIEAETEAEAEMLGVVQHEELESQFLALEKAQRGEEALAKMKANLSSNTGGQVAVKDDDIQKLKAKLRNSG